MSGQWEHQLRAWDDLVSFSASGKDGQITLTQSGYGFASAQAPISDSSLSWRASRRREGFFGNSVPLMQPKDRDWVYTSNAQGFP